MPNLKREYTTEEGWEYLTIESLNKGDNEQTVINRVTHGHPYLYEVAHYAQAQKMAFIIIRRRPVKTPTPRK